MKEHHLVPFSSDVCLQVLTEKKLLKGHFKICKDTSAEAT